MNPSFSIESLGFLTAGYRRRRRPNEYPVYDGFITFQGRRSGGEGCRGDERLDVAVGIGNCHGSEVDKFAMFGLTAAPAQSVRAPLIAECYANFECRLYDGSRVRRQNFFVWEVVKAHVAPSPKRPETFHYRGEGEFMISGKAVSRRSRFLAGNL